MELNYGKFNIRFAAVKGWNHLDENIKHLPLKTFKNKVELNILQSYSHEKGSCTLTPKMV